MASSKNQDQVSVEVQDGPPAQIESEPTGINDSNEQDPFKHMLMAMNKNMGQMTGLLERIVNRQQGQDQGGKQCSKKRLRPSSTAVQAHADLSDQSESDNENFDYRPPAKKGRKDQPDEDELSLHASDDGDEQDSLDVDRNDLLGEACEEQNEIDESDVLLKEFESLYENENSVTDNVSQKLADIANKRWENKLEADKLKKIFNKHKRPANCNDAKPIKVNPSIWRKMGQDKKHIDLKISNLQQTLQKIYFINVQVANTILNAKQGQFPVDIKNSLGNMIDSLALLGHTAHGCSDLRRDLIKNTVKGQLLYLGSEEKSDQNLLFGKDLAKRLKDLNESQQLSQTLTPGKSNFRKEPYGKPQWGVKRGTNRGQYNFLGQGRKPTFKKKNSQYQHQKSWRNSNN
eukprot:gene20745-22774_t